MGGGGEHGALKSPHRAIVARTGVGTLGCGGRGGRVCSAVPYRVPCMLCHRCGTRTLSRYRNACLHTHTAFPGHMAPPPAGPGPSCCPPTTWLEEVETGECAKVGVISHCLTLRRNEISDVVFTELNTVSSQYHEASSASREGPMQPSVTEGARHVRWGGLASGGVHKLCDEGQMNRAETVSPGSRLRLPGLLRVSLGGPMRDREV